MFWSNAFAALKSLCSTTPLQQQPLQQQPLQQPEQLDDLNDFTYYVPATPPTPRRSQRLRSPQIPLQQPRIQQPQPMQLCEPGFFPYDCPTPTPTPPPKSKRQRNLDQLANARESKLRKLSDEEQLAIMEERFWDGAADDVDLDSKEELYVTAMQRLDENWSYKDVTEVSGIAYNTLKTYQGVWKQLGEKDFRFHVEGKKRGRQLFQPLSLLKMQDLNAKIIRDEDAQLVATKQSSYDNVIRPILIAEAEAAGSQSL
jgi:hypothetical protein